MKADSTLRFTVFRVLLGLYVAVHAFALVPYAEELFGPGGMLPDPALNPAFGVFPNPLFLPQAQAAGVATAFCAALGALGLMLAAGLGRRPVALLLWFGWACLFHRNVLIANPSLPYVGFLLLVCAVVPGRVPVVPAVLREGGWLLLAAGYTASGLHKLGAPSWLDGTALTHVLQLPLARPEGLSLLLRDAPPQLMALATWAVLALEVLSLPLALWRPARRPVFFALVAMHVGILLTVDFADLTLGMLLAHVFAWDAVAGRAAPTPSAKVQPSFPTLIRLREPGVDAGASDGAAAALPGAAGLARGLPFLSEAAAGAAAGPEAGAAGVTGGAASRSARARSCIGRSLSGFGRLRARTAPAE